MLFIGIVTASMLKNTGSMSTASIAYGNMSVMNSTVKSGMIATESLFPQNDPITKADTMKVFGLMQMLQYKLKNPDSSTFIQFDQAFIAHISSANYNNYDSDNSTFMNQFKQFLKNKKRAKIADNQYFNSQLKNVAGKERKVKKSNGEDSTVKYTVMSFEVNSGRTENGKALRKALAFYSTDDVKVNNSYGAKNAVYMKGSFANGDNGMNVTNGGVTFEGPVKFNANKPITFHGEAYFNDIVEILSPTTFKNRAYFEKDVTINNLSSGTNWLFEDAVAFKENFTALNATVGFKGDLWYNGTFGDGTDGTDNNFQQLVGDVSNNIYYTSKIPMAGSVTGCGSGPNGVPAKTKCITANAATCAANPTNSDCCAHGCNHIDNLKSNKIATNTFANRDIASAYKGANIHTDTLLNAVGMLPPDSLRNPPPPKTPKTTLELRTDPEISMNSIAAGKIIDASSVTTSSNLDVSKLTQMYNSAKSSGNLYDNEYLVVKISSDLTCDGTTRNATFNDKVIFIVEDGVTFSVNSNFYNSGANASTMVYAGPGNAKLMNFGTNGLFRGLVYIDELNTAANQIKFTGNGKVVGAIHSFANQPSSSLQWNCGDVATEIEFNSDILDGYASLLKGSSGAANKIDYVDMNKKRIILKPMGYYFY